MQTKHKSEISPKKLSDRMVKKLIEFGYIDPHDGVQKVGGSRQDYYECSRTHEIYVAIKHRPEWFEPMGVNTRQLG